MKLTTLASILTVAVVTSTANPLPDPVAHPLPSRVVLTIRAAQTVRFGGVCGEPDQIPGSFSR
jgi:hypothetical protein